MQPEANRAARLVELIRDKVEQNPKCYHTFIEALEADQQTNGDILEQLKEKYDSLSRARGKHIIIVYNKNSWSSIVYVYVYTLIPTESQKQTTATTPHSQVQMQAEVISSTVGQCEPQQQPAAGMTVHCMKVQETHLPTNHGGNHSSATSGTPIIVSQCTVSAIVMIINAVQRLLLASADTCGCQIKIYVFFRPSTRY